MAAKGWIWADQSDSENEEDEQRSTDEEDEISILKIARKLLAMAAEDSARVRYTAPRITILLPRLSRGTPDIDILLKRITELSSNITLLTKEEIQSTPAMSAELLKTMTHDQFARITPVLNLDCTILLAIMSDISHASVPPDISDKTGFSVAIRRQVALEDKTRLLPMLLWPALRGRKLVCVEAAAKRMQEIVDQIGTPEEQARTKVFFGKDSEEQEGDLISRAQKLSGLDIPTDLHLPIEIVKDGSLADTRIPADLGQKVVNDLSELNQAVFIYGWAEGATTITSNRTVVKSIEKTIFENGSNNGPELWVSRTSRSLLAKEKGRKA
jgi:hypothetical protein